MAKVKKSENAMAKENSSYLEKSKISPNPSIDNPSKFQLSQDADSLAELLDPKDGLRKLFIDSIKDIYWAENQLVKSLPKIETATNLPELKKAIASHLKETKKQVSRLDSIFELIGKKPQAKKCDAMEGLTKEGEGVIEDTDKGSPARNLGIIMSSQKVEHYEIAAYRGLIKLAQNLGLDEQISSLLTESLSEEVEADETLSEIAANAIDYNLEE